MPEEPASEVPAWQRLEDESAAAYAAFCSYYLLPPSERSIDTAWRRAAKEGQNRDGKRAPGNWAIWSSSFRWVARATAHDDYLAEQDRLLWQERRRILKEQDWQQAQAARDVINEAIPEASRFITRTETFIEGEDGAPNTIIITERFNMAELARATEIFSKLQKSAANEPTETFNVNLSGAALDAAIERALAELSDRSQAGDVESPFGKEAGFDAGTTDGNEAL